MQILEDRLGLVGVVHRRGLGDLDHHARRIDASLTDPLEDPPRQVRLPELARRKVETHIEVDLQLAPCLGLVDELADDPVSDRFDETELLGEGDEIARRHHRAVRLHPADQRFDAVHASGRELEDRLVVQRPALALHRLPQPGHETELRRGVQRATVGDHVRVAALLRLEHRRFRVAQQISRVVAVLREQADPDGCRDVELRPTRPERHREGIQDALRGRLGSSHRCLHVLTIALEIREQQQERVARAPGDQVRLSRRLAEPTRHHVQDLVSGEAPERVVHQPEVIDVDADHRDGGLVMPRTGDRQLEELFEHRPAGKTGQLVVVREERDLLVAPLDVGDVDHHAEREGRNPSLVPEHLRFVVDPHDAAVLAIHAIVQRERLAGLVVALVLSCRSGAVVGMDDPEPEIPVVHPFVGCVAEEPLDLGTHIEGRGRVVQRIDVGDGRDVLDDRSIPIADDLLGRDPPPALHIVRDRAGHHS